MDYEGIDKSKMTVTMSVEYYEYYSDVEMRWRAFIGMFERANQDGIAVMTDELREVIERIYP